MMPLYEAGMALVMEELRQRLHLAADMYAEGLRDRLSHPGTGIHHFGNPNPSSRRGEYPAIQSGELSASIDAREVDATLYQVGSFDGPAWATELVMRPPSKGGRDYIALALHDDELHEMALSGLLGVD